jgi:hypothetical protein
MQLNYGVYGSFSAVTPNDGTPVSCSAIYIGGAGNITLSTGLSAPAITFTAPPVGTILPIMLDQGRIMATGTTATAIVILQ